MTNEEIARDIDIKDYYDMFNIDQYRVINLNDFDMILNYIKKAMKKTGITSNIDLKSYICHSYHLKPYFRGISSVAPNDMAAYITSLNLKDNEFIINNHNMHWTAIINSSRFLEIDSYNRDVYPEIHEYDFNSKNNQGRGKKDDMSCGQRTLAHLIQLIGLKGVEHLKNNVMFKLQARQFL